MTWLPHELRLLARAPVSAVALGLLLLLTSLAVVSGSSEIARQHQTMARLAALQDQEFAALAARPQAARDAGSAAYYTFHATWDPPTSAAFLALGTRDSAPYVLRVRALALQSQLHEGETSNPALALAGRFDVAFVLIYLAPLVLIALLHDLVSSEKRAGRLGTLLALPEGDHRLWLRRAALRTVLAFGCVALPVLAGAVVNGMPAVGIAAAMVVIAAYLGFWAGLALVVATRGRSSAAHAIALMGSWVLVTLVLPAVANAAFARAIPVHQGVGPAARRDDGSLPSQPSAMAAYETPA
jgi:ABC-2 type transport system permease protein